MKIGLWSDCHNFPSLVLMKLSAYHKSIGDDVEFWQPLMHYDKVYCSKTFTFTPDADDTGIIMADVIEKAGTGYEDYESKLPYEIENIYPDYCLYPQYKSAYGFLTRGCPRGCAFCIVARKEGRCSKQVADLSDFCRDQREIKLLDPNLLACKDHEKLLMQLSSSGLSVDFTQGLDIRLVTRDNISLLNKIKTKMLHFAWDNPDQDLTRDFERFNQFTECKDDRKKRVYVLTNFGSTHEQDLYRIYTLRSLGYDPYVMVYEKQTAPKITRKLQRWCNSKQIFRSCPDFNDYQKAKYGGKIT